MSENTAGGGEGETRERERTSQREASGKPRTERQFNMEFNVEMANLAE